MTNNTLGRIVAVSRLLVPAMFMLGSISEAMAQAALAPKTEIFTTSCGMLTMIKNWIFGVVYVLGAIGLVLVAISAFLGRFKFAHLISLGGGLFIVAAADLLIGFVAGENAKECVA